MTKYRVTTYYTARIDTDVIADGAKEACELVRKNGSIKQDDLRPLLDDIEESWVQHRTAWELPAKTEGKPCPYCRQTHGCNC